MTAPWRNDIMSFLLSDAASHLEIAESEGSFDLLQKSLAEAAGIIGVAELNKAHACAVWKGKQEKKDAERFVLEAHAFFEKALATLKALVAREALKAQEASEKPHGEL